MPMPCHAAAELTSLVACLRERVGGSRAGDGRTDQSKQSGTGQKARAPTSAPELLPRKVTCLGCRHVPAPSASPREKPQGLHLCAMCIVWRALLPAASTWKTCWKQIPGDGVRPRLFVYYRRRGSAGSRERLQSSDFLPPEMDWMDACWCSTFSCLWWTCDSDLFPVRAWPRACDVGERVKMQLLGHGVPT